MDDHRRDLNKRHKAADRAYTAAMVAVQRDPGAGSPAERRQLRRELDQVDAELEAYLWALKVTKYPAAPALA